jgi:hypothetical protein
MARALSVISVRDPGCAEHLENWLSWQGPEAIRSFSSQVLGETTSKAMPAADNPPFLLQFHFFDHTGRYHPHRLIERYGIEVKLFDWGPEADCPRKVARNEHDPCGARCPDLSKVV